VRETMKEKEKKKKKKGKNKENWEKQKVGERN
jgi:hypothetical protein